MSRVVALLWVAVVIEVVSPVPGLLTLGAVWVLLARPDWLPKLVDQLYAEDEEPEG
ncbi:MAG: hypothetical protein AAF602_03940 [Myxococcota bacterium]